MTAPGPHQQFVALVDRHRGILHTVARAYARTPEDRADLVQEIVAELLEAFPRYRADRSFSTWMYRVALNVAISSLRRQVVRERLAVDPVAGVLEEVAVPPADPAREEALRRLDGLIQSLAPLDRALVLLSLDGLRHAAIGEVLGLSETNVGTKLARIRERLRGALEDHRTE